MIGNYLKLIIEKITDLIVQIFEFFFNLFWTDGVLNFFGYFMLIVVSLILISSVIELVIGGGKNDND